MRSLLPCLFLASGCADAPGHRWVPHYACAPEVVELADDEPLAGVSPRDILDAAEGIHSLSVRLGGRSGPLATAAVGIERGDGPAWGLHARWVLDAMHWERPQDGSPLAFPACVSRVVVPVRLSVTTDEGSVDFVVAGEAEATGASPDATFETSLPPAAMVSRIEARDIAALPEPQAPGAEPWAAVAWSIEPSEPPWLDLSVQYDSQPVQDVLRSVAATDR